jgi:glutamate racemase
LVGQIEKGDLETAQTEAILRKALTPMLERGIDTVVLGCTHYPFVIPLIKRVVGPEVRVIDPAPAVARQVQRLVQPSEIAQARQDKSPVKFYTTSAAWSMKGLLPGLLGEDGNVQQLHWVENNLNE